MTAAFAPADRLTFQPRTVADLGEGRPVLQVVPALPEVDEFEPQRLATVHRLPVRPQADVYRRRRLVALALLVGLVLGVASFIQQADATPTPEGQLAESVTVLVQPGDTLWGIATTLAPDADPRGLVDQLSDLAGGSSLQPGQELVIPGHWLD
ncbi:MAG: LysM peptidoglycan-binding domain-containing protein [Actinomycetota bacterium]